MKYRWKAKLGKIMVLPYLIRKGQRLWWRGGCFKEFEVLIKA